MKELNLQALAYLGDCVYELYIRKHILTIGYTKAHDMQIKSLEYVSATRQKYLLDYLINKNILNKEELEIIRKGRNTKIGSKPKNCDIITYRYASSFEVLIGYLYLNNKERLEIIINEIINESSDWSVSVWKK